MILIGSIFIFGLQELCMLNTETGPRRGFYAGLPRSVRAGLEACGYSQWFEGVLEELAMELWLASRRASARPRRAIRRPTATMPGYCLSCWKRTVFRTWVPDKATGDLRQLLMYLPKLVGMRPTLPLTPPTSLEMVKRDIDAKYPFRLEKTTPREAAARSKPRDAYQDPWHSSPTRWNRRPHCPMGRSSSGSTHNLHTRCRSTTIPLRCIATVRWTVWRSKKP